MSFRSLEIACHGSLSLQLCFFMSLEALGSLEREAARCCLPLSPELAMRVKRNREEAMLRRAEKRRLNDDLQRQAESDASAEPAISARSVGA